MPEEYANLSIISLTSYALYLVPFPWYSIWRQHTDPALFFFPFQVIIPSKCASQSKNFIKSVIFSQPAVSQGAYRLLLYPH